jgi:hypothetical protein
MNRGDHTNKRETKWDDLEVMLRDRRICQGFLEQKGVWDEKGIKHKTGKHLSTNPSLPSVPLPLTPLFQPHKNIKRKRNRRVQCLVSKLIWQKVVETSTRGSLAWTAALFSHSYLQLRVYSYYGRDLINSVGLIPAYISVCLSRLTFQQGKEDWVAERL